MPFYIWLLFILTDVYFIVISHAESNKATNISDGMVLIPAGKFKMGCNKLDTLHGSPEHIVHLDAFMIDKYEMTNKKYEAHFPDHKSRRSVLSKCDDCPVTNISWYAAADYCYIIGKSLPTEAQWERSSGSDNGCAFPWGNDFDPTANQARGGLKLRDNTKPVGSFAPNKHGIYDMGGNVWEWVSDWMSPGYQFPKNYHNPKGPMDGLMKVRRGGSYSDSIKGMLTGYRDWSHPSSRYFSDIGFRCVVNIKRIKFDGFTSKD